MFDDMKLILGGDFIKEELYNAIKQMKATTAPGPEGMPALFYQRFWVIMGEVITSLALEVLNGNADHGNINQTVICLIARNKKPKNAGDFRHISLCNVIFKIITKTI